MSKRKRRTSRPHNLANGYSPYGLPEAPTLPSVVDSPERVGPGKPPEAVQASKGRKSLPDDVYGPYLLLPKAFRFAHNQDITQMSKMPAEDLLEFLSVSHSDIGAARNQFVSFADTPYTATAYSVDVFKSEQQLVIDPVAQRVLDQLIAYLDGPIPSEGAQESRSFGQLLSQLDTLCFVQGLTGCEVVALDKPWHIHDIRPINTKSIWFRRDPETKRPIPMQYVRYATQFDRTQGAWMGPYKFLDSPTVIFEPIDPLPNDPTGTPPIAGVLRIVFWHMQVLKDLSAAIHLTGYPRITVKLVEEVVRKNMPRGMTQANQEQWIRGIITQYTQMFEQLGPDDAIVTLDSAAFGYMGYDGGSAGNLAIEKIAAIVDHQLASSTRTPLTLLGRHEGSTETYSSIDIKMYIKFVESLRNATNRAIGRALQIALQVLGYRAIVKFARQEIDLRNAQEREKDRSTLITNELTAWKLGMRPSKEVYKAINGHYPDESVSARLDAWVQKYLDNLLITPGEIPSIGGGDNQQKGPGDNKTPASSSAGGTK